MPDENALADAIRAALAAESAKLYQTYTPRNSRSYGCSVDGCPNKAYAKGLCNAHYIRKRSGKNASAPLRRRLHDPACSACGAQLDGKGGWGLCASHYRKLRRKIVRTVCVDFLGGCCYRCGGLYPLVAYDFHHNDPSRKDFAVSSAFENKSVEALAAEVAKCTLLCANCHRIEHYEEQL